MRAFAERITAMANNIDLNDLDIKLGNDSEDPAEKEAPAGKEAAQEKKLSKAELAELIAKNLSSDEDEDLTAAKIKTPSARSETDPKPAKTEKSKKAGETENKDKGKKKSGRKKPAKKDKKGQGSSLGIFFGFLGGFVLIAVIAFYVGGLVLTNGKFLPNTTIDGRDVAMMTAEQVAELVKDPNEPTDITLLKQDGTNVKIPLENIGYTLDTEEKVQILLDKKDTALWFMSLFNHTMYKLDEAEASFDSEKLKEELSEIDWGDKEPENAYITASDNGFVIIPDEPGDKVDIDKLWAYVKDKLENGETDINMISSNSYIKAQVTSDDLKDKLEQMNAVAGIEITIDFDYTQEVLTGKDFAGWVTFNDDGTYTVDRTKVMGYVEALAEKYDTYDKERKFHATLQGDITVPTSADARYGWWIYQDETADLLVDLIEKGKSVTTDPVYYYTQNADGTKGYIYTGSEEARSAEDDIGNTYVEIDLTAQTLWYYEKGELKHTCGIVSGQLQPAARKTLPGVYKVWFKAKNYKMKSSNSAGESWESTCAYWTRVAIVGIGLHDSQWRGNNVGGQIYKTNGSHGCINMTLKDAKYIYDTVPMGTPVVMYY